MWVDWPVIRCWISIPLEAALLRLAPSQICFIMETTSPKANIGSSTMEGMADWNLMMAVLASVCYFLFHHQTHHSWSHHSIQTHILIHTSRPDSHRYTLRYNESHSSRTKIQVSSMLRLVFQQWPPWVTHRCLYGSRPREKQIRSVDSANSFSNSLPF